jgi:hypothetical protein
LLSSVVLALVVFAVWFGLSLGDDDQDADQAGVDVLSAEAQYDSDVDGVLDAADVCPEQRGLSELHGCWARGTIFITTSADYAHLRTGPGTEYPVADTIARGAQVYILGRTVAGDWLRVRTIPTGSNAAQEAWIAEFLVQFEIDVAVERFPIFTPEN